MPQLRNWSNLSGKLLMDVEEHRVFLHPQEPNDTAPLCSWLGVVLRWRFCISVPPQMSEAYFKVLFSHLPKAVVQRVGSQAAAGTCSDPKEIWDLSSCRCRSLAPFSVFSLPSARSLCLAGAAAPLHLRSPEPGLGSADGSSQRAAPRRGWAATGSRAEPGAKGTNTFCSACSTHEPAMP